MRMASTKKSPAKKPPATATAPAKAKPGTSKTKASAKADTNGTGTGKAAPAKATGDGTKASPWHLTTPPGSSAFTAYRDDSATPPALVCTVGSTVLSYQLRCIADLHAMLKKHGDWMALGGTDEQKPAPANSVEAWARDPRNPVKGWYGLRKGFRGRFGVYVPPVLEVLGLAEVEHQPRNNRMRAI